MGTKSVAPAAPDYTPVAQADAKAAERSFQLGEEQLQWAKDQAARYDPYVMDYLDAQTSTTRESQNIARQQEGMYLETYAPVEQKFVTQAIGYNTPERAAQQSAMARADVSASIDAQRQAALTNLQGYGLDPSQTKYGALDAGYRVAKAAGEAAASTQSRINTENTQLALEGEAINIGRGFPGAVSTAYNTATSAGSAGTKAGDTHFATGASAMGSPTSYFGAGNTALGNQASAMNMGYNNALEGAKLNSSVAAQQAQGVGNIFGTLIGAGTRLAIASDRRLKRDVAPAGYIGKLPIYTFNYIWDTLDEKLRYGFMADEVRMVVPEAVSQIDGYDYVDYSLAISGAMR